MPIEHRIDELAGRIHTRMSGVVDYRSMYDAVCVLPTLHGFRADLDQLVDITDVTEVRATGPEIEALGRMRPFRPPSRRVFVAPTDYLYGLARMYASYNYGAGEVHVVRSMDDAREWLDERLASRPASRPAGADGAGADAR